MIFDTIILRDLSKPLPQRHHKHCGPYMWTPAQPGNGRGFYQASRGLHCGDSTFRLRLEYANDVLPRHSRLAGIDGYYTDEFCDQTISPIIARLPRSRGFLAGWTMGGGMLAAVDADIYDTAEDAAQAAHNKAEYDAEEMQRDEARQREEMEAEEALEDLESGAP